MPVIKITINYVKRTFPSLSGFPKTGQTCRKHHTGPCRLFIAQEPVLHPAKGCAPAAAVSFLSLLSLFSEIGNALYYLAVNGDNMVNILFYRILLQDIFLMGLF